MKSPIILINLLTCLASIATGTIAETLGSQSCTPWTDKQHRIFICSDIANEPDDTMSFVRALAHSDLYNIEGLVAITSFWLPNATYPDQIQDLVDGYAAVRDNLQSHSNFTFPTSEYLSSKIASGPTTYGIQALKALEAGEDLSGGSQLLINAVDASEEPLYVQLWGGANTVASALWYLSRTRSVADVESFSSKLRLYSISDQDDTGIWIRQKYPRVRYIASRHGFNQYPVAAWLGISSTGVNVGGPNNDIVSQSWLTKNIQLGPLGKLYPNVLYIMEGDSPTLLYNIPNGLGDPEHPDWGSWGGRYTANPIHGTEQFGDAVDAVIGQDGKTYTSNQATVWRWREAFQTEFAARIQWTLSPNGPNSNTTHPPIVIVNGTCGASSLELNVQVGQNITLDASSTYSPDSGADLNFTWFQYKEPSSYQSSASVVPTINITSSQGSQGRYVYFAVPEPTDGTCVLPKDVTQFGQWGERSKCPILHLVLAVKDANAINPITRYRRIVLYVQSWTKPRER